MRKPGLNSKACLRFLRKKTLLAAVSLTLAAGMVAGYYLMPASGAVVEVLGGNGSLDNSTQAGTWTLVNVTGTSSWGLDTSVRYAGNGSGRLRSPQGSGISFNGYVGYRFTTGSQLPTAASLNLAYQKTWSNAQPSSGNWNVVAEIWKVGDASPLQTISIDSGTSNVSFRALPSQNVSVITQPNTQYELRLVQRGRTGSNSSARLTTYFDEVKLQVTYDSVPPVPVSVNVVTDTTVDVVFDELVEKAGAENAANYSIGPALAVSAAALQPDGKTVRLSTETQTRGTSYSVSVNNVKDISGNTMTTARTVGFTGIDTTSPVLVSAVSGSNTTVDLLFNEELDPVTAGEKANYAISPSLAVENSALQPDGRTVRLTTSSQTGLTNYTVTVTVVKDISGNTVGSSNYAVFTGKEPPDVTPPAVVSALAVSGTEVDVVFNETVEQVSAQSSANYSISPVLAVSNAEVGQDGKTVRLTTAPQTGGTSYAVTVANVRDLSGNTVSGSNSAVFTGISADRVSPKVLSAVAVNNSRIDVVFDEKLEPLTSQEISNYIIAPALNVTSAFLQANETTVSLTTAPQTPGEAYTITVGGVKDLAGNVLDPGQNTAVFSGSTVTSANPHGRYLDNTNECIKCHITHQGQGLGLLKQPEVNTLCYLCHDAGGQSKFDVATQFGSSPPYASSHHPVPEGNQKCTDCHNPHDGGKAPDGTDIHWPRLLQSSADPTVHGGNQFCFSCHRDPKNDTGPVNEATYPADGVGHNNASFTVNGTKPFSSSSGTGITCFGCHEKHGSELSGLLKKNPNGDAIQARGNDKSFCIECHKNASSDSRYRGPGVFDRSAHSLAASTKTKAAFPGVTGQEGQCANCHDPHGSGNGTSGMNMKTIRGVYNDGKTSYTAGDFDMCFQCHNSSSADPKYNVQAQYSDPLGGHRIKTAGGNLQVGSVLPCEACHTLHGSANNNKYSLSDSLGSNLGDGRNECLACHRSGKTVEGLAMSPPPSSVPEHGSGTTRCLECHGGPHKTASGASQGGADCSTCHSTQALSMKSTGSGYHHLLSDTAATYATSRTGTKNCLSCHVDHNKFNNQKAFNLKANYSESFTAEDTAPGQNTDFNALDTVYGGLCLSCHQVQQVKGYLHPDGTTATPPMSVSGFANSAHNYNATSLFDDMSVFNANCVKCHNDNMTKERQASANKFGNHNSDYQKMLSPFGDGALTDPLKQQFCLKCHDSAGDVYGTTMSTAARDIKNQFSQASSHDITGTGSARLTCVNCHGPHTVSKTPYSAGLNVSDISDPDNTLSSYITASGDLSGFCLRCHDGSPPQQINDGTTFVPYSVTFPAANFTNNSGGWNKSDYAGSSPAGHYSRGYQCDACHNNHGSANPMLGKLPEDPSTAPSANSGMCLKCHGNQTGRPVGAADVYTDLTKGADHTYRHPTLYTSGKHSNTESFPWSTSQRHAECVDCHDPHSARAGNAKTVSSTANTAPKASNVLGKVTGVTVTSWPAAWTSVTTQNYSLGRVTNEYELCFKCHTGFNGNFPAPPSGAIAQTDVAREFNPNNASYHYLGIEGSTSKTSRGTYVAPFDPGTKLYCTSCHGSNGTAVTSPGAIHGSANRYILKAPFTTNTGASGTANDLCYKCHDVNTYGRAGSAPKIAASASGFSNSGDGNLHVSVSAHRVACVRCHSAVPHGYKNKKLLVTTSDPAPYNSGSQLTVNTWAASGSWQKNHCSGCH